MEAQNFFDDLKSALLYAPDSKRVYAAFVSIFHRLLNEATEQVPLHLVGAFAKLDYLLKERKAERTFARRINNTRVRLRRFADTPEEELQDCLMLDYAHLCQLVAFLAAQEIPQELSLSFPSEKETGTGKHLLSDYLRVIVKRWDDTFIYANADDTLDQDEMCVAYQDGDNDRAYLRDILYEGAQLNLIRPRGDEDVVSADYIIFEPDYLVDVSTIASCFTNYAESPIVNLLSRLQPSRNTEAIILGNFAGQLLDEEIHDLTTSHTYADSVMDFFHNNASSILTVPLSAEFHTEAKRQKDNISYAISKALPASLQNFDRREGIVEPSFFSEMLGVQGRMDYLQMDMKVLLEQKSGKGDFPYGDFSLPRFKEEHYVQMLLYMAIIRYNYSAVYDANGHELNAFLLYSKYRESLLGLSWAPQLLFRAFSLRNRLAAANISYAREGGFDFLRTLSPEDVNEKQTDNRLWQAFQMPQVAEVLSPIHEASELERTYYLRFLRFIAAEHLLSKFGNKQKENSGFASKWHDTLSEKLLAGNIYDRLLLVSPDENTTGSISSVRLSFPGNDNDGISNFRVGDIVILYPYDAGHEPDVRRSMVFRCTIEAITATDITLTLRAPQTDNRVFIHYKQQQWALEHDFMESSYSSLYRGMHSFLSAPKDRRDLLLLQRHPLVCEGEQLQGDYASFNRLSLRVKQAKELFLIIGPPGTGKTSFGMLNTVLEELHTPTSSILIMSYTNRAVDEICGKLKEQGIDFLRLGGRQICSEEYKDKLMSERVKSCGSVQELRQMFLSARIIVGTTTSLTSHLDLLRLRHFSLAVVDEASQILEPHLMAVLCAHVDGTPMISKFVLIGDHKQLPAVVQQTPRESKVHESILHDVHLTDCRLSLFERLLKRYHDDDSVVFMLTRQGRMHQDIADFPSSQFYAGRLQVVPLPAQVAANDHLAIPRITFCDVESPQDSPMDKVNENEALYIARRIKQIYDIEQDHFDPLHTVGVIVPYRNQISAIRTQLSQYSIPALLDITIDTVERFQGSQRKYIIFGTTVHRPYQMKFLTDNTFVDVDGTVVDRKLNVAMTRAQEHLLIVGNAQLLSRNDIYRQLISRYKASVQQKDAAQANPSR